MTMISCEYTITIKEELIVEHPTAFIEEPVLFLKVPKSAANEKLTPQELYDATRKAWRISLKRAQKAEYVFSILDNVVLEVYKPTSWYVKLDEEPRLAFDGVLASIDVRAKYIGKEIPELKERQNPATSNFSI